MNPTLLVVSPNQLINGVKKQDIIQEALPDVFSKMRLDNIGEMLECKDAPNLKYIVQTGFYNKPGFLKFRDLLWYRSNKYNLFEKTKTEINRKVSTKNDLTKIVKKNQNTLNSDLLTTFFYLIYDSSTSKGLDTLNDCIQQAESLGVFVNVIPSNQVDELLLEQSFVEDLTNKGGTVILGNKEDISKVQSSLQNERIVFHSV